MRFLQHLPILNTMATSKPSQDLFSWICFLKVLQCGSIRKAAEELNLEPSTISRRISALESELSLKFFDHSSVSGSVLTEEGRIALYNFGPLVQAHETAVNCLKNRVLSTKKTLRITCPIGYSISTLRSAVQLFQKDFPGTRFWLESVRQGTEEFEILGHGIDIIISTVKRENASFSSNLISDHRCLCLAAPEFLKRVQLKEPKDLFRVPTGGHSLFVNDTVFENENTGQKQSLSLDFAIMSDNTYLLLDWAEAGGGVLIASPHVPAMQKIESRRLIPVLLDWRITNSNVFAYFLKNKSSDPNSLEPIFCRYLKKISDENQLNADKVLSMATEIPMWAAPLVGSCDTKM